MSAFELLFKLTADSGDLEKSTASAAKSLNSMGRVASEATANIQERLKGAAKGIQEFAKNG